MYIFNPSINSICTDKHNQYPKCSNNSVHIIPPILKILYNNIRLKVIKKRRTFILLFLFCQASSSFLNLVSNSINELIEYALPIHSP